MVTIAVHELERQWLCSVNNYTFSSTMMYGTSKWWWRMLAGVAGWANAVHRHASYRAIASSVSCTAAGREDGVFSRSKRAHTGSQDHRTWLFQLSTSTSRFLPHTVSAVSLFFCVCEIFQQLKRYIRCICLICQWTMTHICVRNDECTIRITKICSSLWLLYTIPWILFEKLHTCVIVINKGFYCFMIFVD